jgi:Tol biopolymer transport system component
MTAGEKIGPYEIVSFLGAGAMGEVHRARDPRLGRDVAIKTLPKSLGLEPDRVRRFDQEVRAAGTLNHPNVLTIFDTGTEDGVPYLVSELLEGDTLRARLKDGPLPLRRAIELATQCANGLAAAHARGIVHRDLKPENLFVTGQGALKILDFGLAKLTEKNGGSPGDSLAGTLTGAGMFMGTVGYIAPEQARGLPASPASDIFALGCVLHEMVTGQRAFKRDSDLDTMMAILNEDPPALPSKVRAEMPGLEPILRRCLEKQPEARFVSTKDLAFALSMLSGGTQAIPQAAAGPAAKLDSRVTFRRLSFRRGIVVRARFTPDGHSVVYGGAWEGQPVETFWMPIGNPDGRAIGHPGTDLFSVSKGGELALCLKRRTYAGFSTIGTLARAPMGGGAPRQLAQGIEDADWHPELPQLAMVRTIEGRGRIEFPAGKVLFETAGWIGHMRFSRDGKRLAFLHHPYMQNDMGSVMVVDMDGNARVLSEGWGTIRGLTWSADGSEVWFCAHRENGGRGLHAVDLEGHVRMLHQAPGQLTIQDVLPDGRALMTHSTERQAVMFHNPNEPGERDLSWLDWSLLRDISPDGQWLLMVESGEAGGEYASICIRPTDGSQAIQLSQGNATRFSPDGQWILALGAIAEANHLQLLPTDVGEPRLIPTRGLTCQGGKWLPDGRHLLLLASQDGGPLLLYRFDMETGESARIGPDDAVQHDFEISPNGKFVAARTATRPMMLYPIDGGEPVPIGGLRPEDIIQPWKLENESILVLRSSEFPARVDRIELATGTRTLYREMAPPDAAGVWSMNRFTFQPDGQTYGYTYQLQHDDLYLVENLR